MCVIQSPLLTFIQIGHLTLDNASVNEKMMKELEILLKHRSIPFDAKENRIR